MRAEVLTADQWPLWRGLRLQALQDTPIGFGEWYADAALRSDDDWAAIPGRPGVQLLAWDGPVAVGMAGGFVDDAARPTVYAVFVQPTARGRGVLDVLLAEVGAWASGLGAGQLRLEVHEDNAPAISAYLRLGFAFTGVRRPYNLDESRQLHEMVRPL